VYPAGAVKSAAPLLALSARELPELTLPFSYHANTRSSDLRIPIARMRAMSYDPVNRSLLRSSSFLLLPGSTAPRSTGVPMLRVPSRYQVYTRSSDVIAIARMSFVFRPPGITKAWPFEIEPRSWVFPALNVWFSYQL
jgi:hypothetical protein